MSQKHVTGKEAEICEDTRKLDHFCAVQLVQLNVIEFSDALPAVHIIRGAGGEMNCSYMLHFCLSLTIIDGPLKSGNAI